MTRRGPWIAGGAAGAPSEPHQAGLVLWLGAAGGVGVTSAVAAASAPGDIAIDLDLHHAALGPALGVPPGGPTLGGLLELRAGDIDQLDLLALASAAPSRVGVRVLAAPREQEVADGLDADRIGELLAVAAATHRRVLVDGGSRVDAIVDCACARASTIVLVARDGEDGIARAADLVALLRRGAIRARIELDLRDRRRGHPVPAGHAAFDLGVSPCTVGARPWQHGPVRRQVARLAPRLGGTRA